MGHDLGFADKNHLAGFVAGAIILHRGHHADRADLSVRDNLFLKQIAGIHFRIETIQICHLCFLIEFE